MNDRYWFDNSLSDEGVRLRLLEAIADPRSISLLSELPIEEGWRCAELGAGGGSMAVWLTNQVGERGSVLAVDRDVTLLRPLVDRPNVQIVESAIEDLDWPPASVDLIHTRNVLMHIDDADSVIAKLVDMVRPGGVLLLEEADYFPLTGITSPALAEVFGALTGNWTWARTMPNVLSKLPVQDLKVTVDASMLRGRSPEAAFWTHTLRSVEKRLIDPVAAKANSTTTVSQEMFDEALELLADDKFWTPLAAVVCISCTRE